MENEPEFHQTSGQHKRCACSLLRHNDFHQYYHCDCATIISVILSDLIKKLIGIIIVLIMMVNRSSKILEEPTFPEPEEVGRKKVR